MEAAELSQAAAEAPEQTFFVATVEDGAMMDAPVYEAHRRGKNWMALINCDPASPGGLSRMFLKPGKGAYYYIVDQSVVGKAVEFGGDYYSGSGSKSARRFYGVVESLTGDEIRIREYKTGRGACKAAEARQGPDLEALKAEREKLISRLAEINMVLGDEDDE